MQGKKQSKESNQKRREKLKGRKLSEITKQKISEAHKGNKYNLGKHHSEETKRKIGLTKKGAKNPQWKGGISPENDKRTKTFEWNIIRKQVYKRDNWTCQICKKHLSNDIQAHHIVPYRISQDDRPENLITLCISCHRKEEHRYYKGVNNNGNYRNKKIT